MSTENMPTTNQSPEEATFADKIPPTAAEGFKQGAGVAANVTGGAMRQAASGGMNT